MSNLSLALSLSAQTGAEVVDPHQLTFSPMSKSIAVFNPQRLWVAGANPVISIDGPQFTVSLMTDRGQMDLSGSSPVTGVISAPLSGLALLLSKTLDHEMAGVNSALGAGLAELTMQKYRIGGLDDPQSISTYQKMLNRYAAAQRREVPLLSLGVLGWRGPISNKEVGKGIYSKGAFCPVTAERSVQVPSNSGTYTGSKLDTLSKLADDDVRYVFALGGNLAVGSSRLMMASLSAYAVDLSNLGFITLT